MNIKEKLSCKYCHNIFKEPINLTCCGDKICKWHIEQQITKNKFTCPLCNQENTNQNFHCDKLIENLIEMELHKFKFDPKYETELSAMKLEIESLENILKNPEKIIDEEISELKRKVNLDRKNLNTQIDKIADDLIQQLESYEIQFKADIKKNLDLEKCNNWLESSRRQLVEFEKCLNLFSIENKERDEKLMNILQPKIKNLKHEIYSNLNLKINYIPVKNNLNGLFGKLILEVSFQRRRSLRFNFFYFNCFYLEKN